MSKGMDSKKAAKKKPAKTADEKRADKKAKKTDTGLCGHYVDLPGLAPRGPVTFNTASSIW